MIIQGTKIIGLNIFSRSEGKKIGKVKDIILDAQQKRLRALVTQKPNLLSDGKIIRWKDVLNLDASQVEVESSAAVVGGTTAPPPVPSILKKPKYITKTELKTDSGQKMGKAQDVLLDTESGQVQAIEAKEGSNRIAVPVDKIVNVSDKETVIKPSQEMSVVGPAESPTDKLKGKIQELKAKAGETAIKMKAETVQSSAPSSASYELPQGTTVHMPDGNEFTTIAATVLNKK